MSQHVVHVADYGNPAPGSFVPAVLALANELHQRGDRCSLIAPDVPGAVWHDEARAGLDSFATASGRLDLFRQVLSAAPDVLHVHFVGWSLPATLAAYARGARVIWHLHSAMRDDRTQFQTMRQIAKYRWFGAGVRTFVTVSELLREAIVRLGVAASRTAVVRNGVDTAHFRPPSADERRNARDRFGIGEGERVLLYFGRDIEVKGGDILWQALDRQRVVLLGVGLPERAIAEFSARVRTIALPFAGDAAPLYWAADTLVMPSRREGAPYAMLEALCTGLPVIASDIPAIAEIAHGEASVILVPNLPEALSCALRDTAEGRSSVLAGTRARFGLDRWVGEIADLYAA
jgi:glycosyltransferase involved in cell wall biosynthesis